jgi:hypothetical protein
MLSDSYSNLQILTQDAEAVRHAIHVCDIGSAKVLARPDVKWVSVYPFLTEDDYGYLKVIAEKIAGNLHVPVFGFIVPRASEFRYALFQNDHLQDEYHLTAGPSSLATTGGNIDLLLKLCATKQSKTAIRQILQPGQLENYDRAGDRMAQQFGELLAIPRAQLCTGYNHLKWAQAGR